jgi:Fur family ferric uptake transcriptional regulator
MTEVPFLRNTKQRRVILEELRKISSHPTASELFTLVKRRLPKISLATVYRNLEQLGGMDLVKKLETGGREVRYDGDVEPHHHLRCSECGRVKDLPLKAGGGIRKPPARAGTWKITGTRLEFVGICPTCQKKKAPKERGA